VRGSSGPESQSDRPGTHAPGFALTQPHAFFKRKVRKPAFAVFLVISVLNCFKTLYVVMQCLTLQKITLLVVHSKSPIEGSLSPTRPSSFTQLPPLRTAPSFLFFLAQASARIVPLMPVGFFTPDWPFLWPIRGNSLFPGACRSLKIVYIKKKQ